MSVDLFPCFFSRIDSPLRAGGSIATEIGVLDFLEELVIGDDRIVPSFRMSLCPFSPFCAFPLFL